MKVPDAAAIEAKDLLPELVEEVPSPAKLMVLECWRSEAVDQAYGAHGVEMSCTLACESLLTPLSDWIVS